jgi:hypothetical protein
LQNSHIYVGNSAKHLFTKIRIRNHIDFQQRGGEVNEPSLKEHLYELFALFVFHKKHLSGPLIHIQNYFLIKEDFEFS